MDFCRGELLLKVLLLILIDSLKILNPKVKEIDPRITLKQAILANLIVGPIALALYFPLELDDFRILGEEYYFHALLSFICFTIIPCIYHYISVQEQPMERKALHASLSLVISSL